MESEFADAPRPRILGLTASLIHRDVEVKDLDKRMVALECALDATIVTASDLVCFAYLIIIHLLRWIYQSMVLNRTRRLLLSTHIGNDWNEVNMF